THHAYLRRELPLLDRGLAAVLTAHGLRYGKMLGPLAETFTTLRQELDVHMMKEERVLFPFIERAERSLAAGTPVETRPFGTFRNPIQMMEHEHDSVGRALSEARRLTSQYTLPTDACSTFRMLYAGLVELERDLHLHIHLENNILFPRALALEALIAKGN